MAAHHPRMIIVAGEALIDLMVHPDGRLAAVPGGGPFNTARTIARLGGQVAFLGRLSADRFGELLRRELEVDGVDLGWSVACEVPTTLAVAELDGDGSAQYRFYLAETSAPGLALDDVLTAWRTAPDAVHLGTLGLVAEPIASALAAGLGGLDSSTLVMVDPNCRPRVIPDREAYVHRLRGVLARADVVKVSGDDLAFMAPDVAPGAAARAVLDLGPRVVLLTDGARTVRVFADGYAFDMPVPMVEVVDTVGAGDAFGGAFLAWLMEAGGGRGGLAEPEVAREAVGRAVRVASLTCQRPGADPPRRSEVGWPGT
jgi:fructokinase